MGAPPESEHLPPGVTRRVFDGNTLYVLSRTRRGRRSNWLILLGVMLFASGLSIVLLAPALARWLGWQGPQLDGVALAAFGPTGGMLAFCGLVTCIACLAAGRMQKQVEIGDGAAWFSELPAWYRVDRDAMRAIAVEVGPFTPERFDAVDFEPERYDEQTDVSLLVGVEGGWLRTLTHQSPRAIVFVADELRRRFDVPPRDPPAGQLTGLIEDGRGRWIGIFNFGMTLLFGVGLLGFYFVKVRPIRDAPTWPRVTATVTKSKLKDIGTSRRPATRPILEYTYVIDGNAHRSQSSDGIAWSTEFVLDVDALVESHPKGSTLEVAVDPENPTRSLVETESIPVATTLPVGLIPAWGIFLGFGIHGLLSNRGLHPRRKDFIDHDKAAFEAQRLQEARRAKLRRQRS